MREISWLAEDLLACQEGLCSISYLVTVGIETNIHRYYWNAPIPASYLEVPRSIPETYYRDRCPRFYTVKVHISIRRSIDNAQFPNLCSEDETLQ